MEKPTWNEELARLWARYPAPIRPSKGCVDLFRFFAKFAELELKRKPNVLLIGSTPELRDLCSETNLPTTVVDFSRANYEALGSLLSSKPYKVTFVEDDWRTMRLDDRFDLVLAEASINVVPNNDVDKLIARIHKYMKPGALFVAKTWITPKSLPDLANVISEYRMNWSDYDFYGYACGALWLHYYRTQEQSVSLREMNEGITTMYKRGILKDSEFASIQALEYPNVDLKLFLPTQSLLLEYFSPYFRSEVIALSNYMNSYLYPFFVLRAS